MSTGARHGFRRALRTMAGCFLAVMIIISIALLGVSALLEASPDLFRGLRLLGAFYLIFLGIRSWRSKISIADSEVTAKEQATISNHEIFWKGFFIGISNPKLILFATAFFPQFIDPEKPQALQLAILLTSFTICEWIWYASYATGGAAISGFLKKPGNQIIFNRAIGVLFIGFGIFTIVL